MPFEARVLEQILPAAPTTPRGEAPLALPYPRSINYDIRIEMPEEWGFDLTDLHIKNDSYQFDFTPSLNGSTITLHYYLKTFKDNIPAAALSRYKTDYQAIQDKISFNLYESMGDDDSKSSPRKSTPSIAPFWSPAYWPAIWMTFFFAMIVTWLFRRLNQRAAFTQQYSYNAGFPIAGWTIVLGVGLALGGLWNLAVFIRSDFYSAAHWASLDDLGGAPLRYLIFSDLLFSLISLAGVAAVFYWFLKKRDIFPSMFTWYVGILLGGQLALIVYSRMLPPAIFKDGHLMDLTTQFIRTCIYGAVWVTYVQRSERVRNTFIHGPY